MHLKAKLNDKQRAEVVKRYTFGETQAALAKEFKVSISTIGKIIKKANAGRPMKTKQGPRATPAAAIVQFAKRARSILWRQESGVVKKSYDKWKQAVEELKKNGGYTQQQAIVQVSKDFPCLRRLFKEYNVSDFDPNPDSHPTVENWGQKSVDDIECEGKKQSHRQNLMWAIEAAGKYLRTDITPSKAPNDAAYYLYRQAIEEPKDFLGKFTQIESRADDEGERQRRSREKGQRSISEIEEMLAELDNNSGGIPPYTGNLEES